MEPREKDTRTVTREEGTLIVVTVRLRVLLRLASLATRNEDLARRLTKSLLAFEQKKSLEATLLCKLWLHQVPHFLRVSTACVPGRGGGEGGGAEGVIV